MASANDRIHARLIRAEEPPRKSLSIPFKSENIQKLDALAKAMTQHSGNTVTRNMLIEDAVESFIEEALTVFSEKDIDLTLNEADDFDTVIFPAQDTEAYRKTFFEDRQWKYVRIDRRKIPKIQYIALYVGAPQSAICHYAKVAQDGFLLDEHLKKYTILLDGDPIALSAPIPLGSATPLATRSAKYTTLQKLLASREYRDLYTSG